MSSSFAGEDLGTLLAVAVGADAFVEAGGDWTGVINGWPMIAGVVDIDGDGTADVLRIRTVIAAGTRRFPRFLLSAFGCSPLSLSPRCR